MIISHKHKFIFIKPLKVAGTSLEISLARHCDSNDVITPLTSFSEKSDESAYTHSARNYKKEGYFNHITPAEIKNKVGEKVWNEYFKITVVRNPWDQIVSRYFWELGISKMPLSEKVTLEAVKRAVLSLVTPKSNGIDNGNLLPKKAEISSFQKFVRSIDESWTNKRYYFDENDNTVCDYYIAYENLQEDYSKVCNRLGVMPEPLTKTKNRQRKT
ncbi:MAG: sulfotransferase family protein, partial [Proteobacteria bacterium]|nr:sulfotransferase family protein [Pseudomonadota bacterium]